MEQQNKVKVTDPCCEGSSLVWTPPHTLNERCWVVGNQVFFFWERCTPVHTLSPETSAVYALHPPSTPNTGWRQTTHGPSWGHFKVNFYQFCQLLTTIRNKMAPRTGKRLQDRGRDTPRRAFCGHSGSGERLWPKGSIRTINS